MAPEAVQPLRINKSNSNSPAKMSNSGTPRPLSEISPMGIRRNSPSFNQATKTINGGDSSPFEASPSNNASPLLFWKNRENVGAKNIESENLPLKNASPSPVRRPSLEKLKNASRVTNNNMFVKDQDSECDPDRSSILSRSTERPLSTQVQGNAWEGTGIEGARSQPAARGHQRTQSATKIPTLSPTKLASPSKDQASPQKSSLSSNSRYAAATEFDPDEGTWSDDGRSTRGETPRSLRQAKSVTFDVAPPQINEYEMITPDPSSVASGSREGSCESDPFDMDEEFERDDSMDREDSFDESLEDADKTPVVLPEDWRFMSPEAANTDLAETFDDPFDEPVPSTSPAARYRATPERDTGLARSNSTNSNGEQRPLPPVPALSPSPTRQSMTKALSSPPPPASISKADILNMRASPMPLSERLRLLTVNEDEKVNEEDVATPVNEAKDLEQHNEELPKPTEISKAADESIEYKPPPRVSRASILRSVKLQENQDFEYEDSSPAAPRPIDYDEIDYDNLDPDVPIQSREESSDYCEYESLAHIKQEEEEAQRLLDMYTFPETVDDDRPVSPIDECGIDSSVIHYNIPISDCSEIESEYDHSFQAQGATLGARDVEDAASEEMEDAPTPRAATPPVRLSDGNLDGHAGRISLPELAFNKEDFGFGLQSYMTPSPPAQQQESANGTGSQPLVDSDHAESAVASGEHAKLLPSLIDDLRSRETATPESVIHHPIEEESPSKESPAVPEPIATIKAPGSKLKTRVSATPSDLHAMAFARRQVSTEQPPAIDDSETEDKSQIHESYHRLSQVDESFMAETESSFANGDDVGRDSLNVDIGLPLSGVNDGLNFGVNEEFDRLMEAKKKGYLMRQNTKLVVASTRQASGESKASESSINEGSASAEAGVRETKSAGNSPRKHTQTWTTEPWNGRMRRQSTRRSNIVPERGLGAGHAPPLPGQESNVNSSLDSVAEDQYLSAADEIDESGERGRLFVKVVGVKDLDLPLPESEQCHFQMTLDNGLHCVTTSWAELGRTAPIGQEFELVVFDDLEFQLTLQTKLQRPQSSASSTASSFTPSVNSKKTSALSKIFTSPKKRRELERKQREEEEQAARQRQQDLDAQRANEQRSAWDLQNELVGPDGSFARAYVCLSNHERQAYGRQYSVDVPCWNEWAIEDKSVSTRSKTGGVQRKPPYKIAKMELQLLYIPRPRNATEDDLPKSMSAAIRQLKDTESASTRQFEGHLSQQGGDCPYWRRRFFKLNGTKLTAYHDMTRQPRATISLAKASKLVDDRSSLQKNEPSSPAKKTGRRKSAFAADEEGYMFVEEGFRIRFANGEVIDFYADSREQKEEWMRVLSQVIGKEGPEEKTTWMSLVLARERATAAAMAQAASKRTNSNAKSEQKRSCPPTPRSESRQEQARPGSATQSTAASPKKENLPPSVLKGRAVAAGSEAKPAPIDKDAKHSGPTMGQTPSKKPEVSPSKTPQVSPSKAKGTPSTSKRNSAVIPPSKSANSSPQKREVKPTGRRQAVRSMIF